MAGQRVLHVVTGRSEQGSDLYLNDLFIPYAIVSDVLAVVAAVIVFVGRCSLITCVKRKVFQ